MPCAVVPCNALRALPSIAAVGVRVMCFRWCSLSPLCIGLCRVSVDARSRVVAQFRAPWCNGLPREIAWRVYVFRVSLCQRLFVVAPLVVVACALVVCGVPECYRVALGWPRERRILHVLLVCAQGRRARLPVDFELCMLASG